MKEITRRNFLRMATIAVLISGMGMLSSCGKSKEELMSGDWYLQGDDRLSLSLYDDGTCQIQGDYGQGKWSIVDEDTLKLTDFYGETRTYPITAVDDNSLELESLSFESELESDLSLFSEFELSLDSFVVLSFELS